jgi:hypothetical protein
MEAGTVCVLSPVELPPYLNVESKKWGVVFLLKL